MGWLADWRGIVVGGVISEVLNFVSLMAVRAFSCLVVLGGMPV